MSFRIAGIALVTFVIMALPLGSPTGATIPQVPPGGFSTKGYPCRTLSDAQFPYACTFPLGSLNDHWGVGKNEGKWFVLHTKNDSGQVYQNASAHVIFSEAALKVLNHSESKQPPLVYVILPETESGVAPTLDGQMQIVSLNLNDKSLSDCIEECALQNLIGVGFFELLCVVALVTLALASGGIATPLIISTAQSCATAPLSAFLDFAACVAKCMCLKTAVH